MTSYQENLEYISKHLSDDDKLCQLAEEAAELAQAALKLRRTFSKDNPTPISFNEARCDLLGEIADVLNCLSVCGIPYDGGDSEYIDRKQGEKLHRWAQRLSKL